MKSYYENREVFARKMMEEALPDAGDVFECIPIKYVPDSKWIQGRDEVAKCCGESKHKRQLMEKELAHSENVMGEFISGSKGRAVVFKKSIVTNSSFHIEALAHEFAHVYCTSVERKEGYIPVEFSDAQFPNDEVQYGYNMWKEFAAQGICKKVCAKNGLVCEGGIIEELEWYLDEIVYRLSGEGDIGMFFAELFFDGRMDKNTDRKALLRELLEDYDEEVQECFLELYTFIHDKQEKKNFWQTDVESLEDLGGMIENLKYTAQVNKAVALTRRRSGASCSNPA